jgi:hypothetical protein
MIEQLPMRTACCIDVYNVYNLSACTDAKYLQCAPKRQTLYKLPLLCIDDMLALPEQHLTLQRHNALCAVCKFRLPDHP